MDPVRGGGAWALRGVLLPVVEPQGNPPWVAYAVWSGLGTVGSVLLGVLVWREALGPAHLAGLGLIVAGVVVLNVIAGDPGE